MSAVVVAQQVDGILSRYTVNHIAAAIESRVVIDQSKRSIQRRVTNIEVTDQMVLLRRFGTFIAIEPVINHLMSLWMNSFLGMEHRDSRLPLIFQVLILIVRSSYS